MDSEPRTDRITAFLWTIFSLGGFVVAFLLPVHILLNNIAVSLGLIIPEMWDLEAVVRRLGSPIVKVYIIVLVAGSLWHGFYRLKYLLYDAGLNRHRAIVGAVLHGLAGIGTALAIYYVLLLS